MLVIAAEDPDVVIIHTALHKSKTDLTNQLA